MKSHRPQQRADSQGDRQPPAAVPTVAKQAGEVEPHRARRVRWCWAEASVWTDRMLTASSVRDNLNTILIFAPARILWCTVGH
ncbi:MAG: hypothetical protein ACP5I8_10105, partial [Phycisphaerae bacterium]